MVTRAVLVGCGSISRTWLRALQGISQVSVVGLVDLIQDRAQERAQEFGLQEALVSSELEQAVRQTQAEVVFNCTVPEAHHPVALQALELGCHVLTEKPLADSLPHAQEMISAAQRASRILAVIQNRRYQPEIRLLRQLVESDAIGKLTTVNSDFYLGAHFGGFRDHMRHVLLLDMAIHTFDQARFISGADPVSVYCKEWNPEGSWYDHDASAMAIFEMSDGLVYSYRGSWCAEGLNTSWEADWRLVGTRGTILWDGSAGIRAERVRAPGGFTSELEEVSLPEFSPGTKVGGHQGVIREFIACVQHGQVPETVASDNIKSLAMVFAAIESARTHQPVPVRW